MVELTDYLYEGHTVPQILHLYSKDLRDDALEKGNLVDLAHANFLDGIMSLLTHNDFLTVQSQKIREFYKYMASRYPFLSFSFKGRIKSLIRAEEKFNGYILEAVYDQYRADGTVPPASILNGRIKNFRDLIAYRIVISMPKCHLKAGEDREDVELKYLYEIANALPVFLEERGFTAELAGISQPNHSPRLAEAVAPYYRDYIANQKNYGYRSLHVTFFDNSARCDTEIQLRTKEMDDDAEIGEANHSNYKKHQEYQRARREAVPEGACPFFDDAFLRIGHLQELDLSKVDVDMFTAVSNYIMNDECGLYRGRLILPYEHLSGYQNDLID